MEKNEMNVLDMLGGIYEDLDIDKIEEKFVGLVSEIFRFDRVALFFVKHRKQVLQGKLCLGFDAEEIKRIEMPIRSDSLFTRPLITGIPSRLGPDDTDESQQLLGLINSALVPIVSKKRLPCWEIKNCGNTDCPAYGHKWLRCWEVSGTNCSGGPDLDPEEKRAFCSTCPIFADLNIDSVEGIMVVDNSVSNTPITEETINFVAVISHTVGMAINNSKIYKKTLDVAIRDPLTGLHNRRYFNERLLDEVERADRYGDTLSLLMCDIDHFKRINDQYGHPVGDEVLCWVADILRKNLRKTDVISRYGGEEFAALLLNVGREQALLIAEKMRKSIETERFLNKNGEIGVTLSFGISSFGEDAHNFEGLIESADKALYRAKARGRNRVCTP